jgi:hypothetical protein
MQIFVGSKDELFIADKFSEVFGLNATIFPQDFPGLGHSHT